MKKIISLILLSIICLSFFACTPSEVKKADAITFDGTEFILCDGHKGTEFIVTEGAREHTDKMLEQIRSVEEEFDCTVTITLGTLEELTKAFAIWEHYADVMSLRISHLYSAFASDYIIPLEDISTIDLYSGKYGPASLLEELTWQDDHVAFWPAYWGIPQPAFQDALMYNPRLITEFNLADPQELYEKDQWNWSIYQTMAETVANAVNYYSTEESPIWFSVLDHYTLRMALFSNGVRAVEKGEDGKYYSQLTSSKAIQAYDWVSKLGAIESFMEYESHMDTGSKFYSGNMIFYPEYTVTGLNRSASSLSGGMEDGWKYCYAPIGPSGTKEDVTTGHFSLESRFLFACRLSEDPDLLGMFMEELFEPTYDTEYGWDYAFYMANFFDEFSEEYYRTKWNNIKSDNSQFLSDFVGDTEDLAKILDKLNSTSLGAWIDANEDRLQQEVDDRINNLKR